MDDTQQLVKARPQAPGWPQPVATPPLQRAAKALVTAASGLQRLSDELKQARLQGDDSARDGLRRLAPGTLQGLLTCAAEVVQITSALLDNYTLLDFQTFEDDAQGVYKEASRYTKVAAQLEALVNEYKSSVLTPAKCAAAIMAAAPEPPSHGGRFRLLRLLRQRLCRALFWIAVGLLCPTPIGFAVLVAAHRSGSLQLPSTPALINSPTPAAPAALAPAPALNAVDTWASAISGLTQFASWMKQELHPASALDLPAKNGSTRYVTAAAALEPHWHVVRRGARSLADACRRYNFASLNATQELEMFKA